MPAYVQSKSTSSNSTLSTTTTLVMTSSLTAGNAVVGLFSQNTTSDDLVSITDGLGNSCTVIDKLTANFDYTYTFYRENITGGASTFTVTTTAAHGYRNVVIHEVSGVLTSGALSVHALAAQALPGTGTDAVTSGAVVTTTANAYLFGAVHVANTLVMTVASGSSYTNRESIDGTTTTAPLESEDRILATAGSVAATFTQSSNQNTHTGIVALHAAVDTTTLWAQSVM